MKFLSFFQYSLLIAFDRNLAPIQKYGNTPMCVCNIYNLFILSTLQFCHELMTIFRYVMCSLVLQEIQRLARGSESFSLSKYMMYRRLGELVYMRYLVKYKKEVGILEKLKAVYKEYLTWYLDNDRKGVYQRTKIYRSIQDCGKR